MQEKTEFQPLCPEHRNLYLQYYKKSGNPAADLSFVSRLAWSKRWDFHFLEKEDTLLIRNEKGNKRYYAVPLGLEKKEQLQKIVDFLWEKEKKSTEAELIFLFLTEKDKELFASLEGYVCDFSSNRNHSDYIYEREQLRHLEGKKLHAKRNHIRKFWSLHPEARYEVLEPKHYEACIELTKEWTLARGMALESEVQTDFQMIASILSLAKKQDLGLKGGVLFDGEKLLAFGIYACDLNEYAVCHFEKARDDEKEAYPVINQLCVENLCDHVKYINREEDMGIEGLRKAKLSYYPERLLEKTTAVLRKKIS